MAKKTKSTVLKPNKKTISANGYLGRVNSAIKHGQDSALYKALIQRQDLAPREREILTEEKINIWKKFNTPVVMLMDEYAQLKQFWNVKLLKGADPTDREARDMARLLLDISKEINHLTQVSADKKADIFSRTSAFENLEFEIDDEEDKNG